MTSLTFLSPRVKVHCDWNNNALPLYMYITMLSVSTDNREKIINHPRHSAIFSPSLSSFSYIISYLEYFKVKSRNQYGRRVPRAIIFSLQTDTDRHVEIKFQAQRVFRYKYILMRARARERMTKFWYVSVWVYMRFLIRSLSPWLNGQFPLCSEKGNHLLTIPFFLRPRSICSRSAPHILTEITKL